MSLDGTTQKPLSDKEAEKAVKAKNMEDRIDAINSESNRAASARKKEADIKSKKESEE
jgi:hypothetical protein